MGKDTTISNGRGGPESDWGADFEDIEEGETSDYEPTLAQAPLVGRKYRITKLLGEGGMGRVFLAKDRDLGRMVALKVLSEELSKDRAYAERLRREARAVASIGHPNIVQVFEFGETADGCPFLAMEMLEGRDLGEELERLGVLSSKRSVDLCGQVLFALSSAHRSGVVHRDLKPGNIFLTSRAVASWTDLQGSTKGETEVAKILDFGISRFLDPATSTPRLTSKGVVMGTPYYIAPEQIRDMGSVDGRADLFAVGVILYECLTGRLPFVGDNVHSVLHHVIAESPQDPREHNAKIPKGLAEVTLRAMEKKPSDRFQDADEFIAALRPFREAGDKDSWSGRPFVLDHAQDESSSSRNRGTFELASGDLTPVAPMELTSTLTSESGSSVATYPGELAGEEKDTVQTDVPILARSASARRARPLAILGGVAFIMFLVAGVYVVGSWNDQRGGDIESSMIGSGATKQPMDPTGALRRDAGQKTVVVSSGDGGSSKGMDASPVEPEAGATDATAEAMGRASDCLERRDRECCLSALSELQRTTIVKQMLRRCRRVGAKRSKAQRPPEPPQETKIGSKTTTSGVPVARDAPW